MHDGIALSVGLDEVDGAGGRAARRSSGLIGDSRHHLVLPLAVRSGGRVVDSSSTALPSVRHSARRIICAEVEIPPFRNLQPW